MIAILGMAHSGTTVMASTLAQCPDLCLYTSGRQGWLLECDEIAPGKKWNAAKLKAVQAKHPNKELLIKRPWAESQYEWWDEHFPDVKMICMIRPFVDVHASWTGKRSLCPDLKNATIDECWERYEHHLLLAALYPPEQMLLVDYGRLCKWPIKTMIWVADRLHIDHTFNTSTIGKPKSNIKDRLWNEYLRRQRAASTSAGNKP
jgi:hypothetical protein